MDCIPFVAALLTVSERVGDFRHFHHKRGHIASQVIACANLKGMRCGAESCRMLYYASSARRVTYKCVVNQYPAIPSPHDHTTLLAFILFRPQTAL